jgi:hypothetical protein
MGTVMRFHQLLEPQGDQDARGDDTDVNEKILE